MVVKKKLKKPAVFKAVNVLLLLAIISFYTYRLIHYYRLENVVTDPNQKVFLADKILKKESFVDLNNGLVRDEDTNVYSYKGEVEDNYLFYSGLMYRIVGLDNETNIKLITDEVVTTMPTNIKNGFEKSYLNSWLNKTEEKYSSIFLSNLTDNEKYLKGTYNCYDAIIEITDIKCEVYNNESLITILSLNDYELAGGENSYLNIGETWGLINNNEENEWYVNEEGSVSLTASDLRPLGIRPVITISSDIEYLKGTGSKEDPYIINEIKKEKTSDIEVGEYIKFSDLTWRVVKSEETVKLVLDGYIMEKEIPLSKPYSSEDNKLSLDKNNIGYYLNNDFYKSLKDKEFIVKSDWFMGEVKSNTFKYTEIYGSKLNLYVGFLNFSEMFVNEYESVFTMTPSYESENIIYTINEINSLYGDFYTAKYNIRPSLAIKNDIDIKSGKGTKNDPYIIGGN